MIVGFLPLNIAHKFRVRLGPWKQSPLDLLFSTCASSGLISLLQGFVSVVRGVFIFSATDTILLTVVRTLVDANEYFSTRQSLLTALQ